MTRPASIYRFPKRKASSAQMKATAVSGGVVLDWQGQWGIWN